MSAVLELVCGAADDAAWPPQDGDGAAGGQAAHRPSVEPGLRSGRSVVVEGEPRQHDQRSGPVAEADEGEPALKRTDGGAHAGLASERRRATTRDATITIALTRTRPASAGTRCAVAPAVPLTA